MKVNTRKVWKIPKTKNNNLEKEKHVLRRFPEKLLKDFDLSTLWKFEGCRLQVGLYKRIQWFEEKHFYYIG